MNEMNPKELFFKQFITLKENGLGDVLDDPEKYAELLFTDFQDCIKPEYLHAPIIFCLGVPRGLFCFLPGHRVRSSINPSEFHTPKIVPAVTVWNEKTNRWKSYGVIRTFSNCPTCDKPIRVIAIRGSTYLTVCSDQCYEQWKVRPSERHDPCDLRPGDAATTSGRQ